MSSPSVPPSLAARAARRILVVAALLQILLFVWSSRGQFREIVSPGGLSRPQFVGATIAGIDCHGYYAWLRSPLIDGDWDFTNEYLFYQAHWPNSEGPLTRTAIGKVANHWSVGPAIVWSVTVVPVHFALTAAGVEGEELPGYAAPYQLAVGVVTLVLSLATLVLAYRIASVFAEPVIAASAAGMVVLATPILAYGTVAPGMAHGPAAAALAAYVCTWVRTFGSTRLARWFAVGLLLGVTCLMRWQLATFAILPALEALWRVSETRRWRRAIALLSCAASGSVVGFVPQMVAWWVVYGRPIVNPHPTVAEWLAPSFWQVLFSTDRSLFYGTPVALLGVVGLLAACRTGQPNAVRARFLLIAFAIQVYLMAALIDRGICLGSSFGFRFLTESVVTLAVGVAVFFRHVVPLWPGLLATACGAAICWNVLLVEAFARDLVGEMDPLGLLTVVGALIRKRPIPSAVIVVLTVGFALRLAWAFQAFRAVPPAPATEETRAPVGVLARLLRPFWPTAR